MTEPVTSAIASAIASHSVSKIVGYIENSDQPEEVWKESGVQIAIKLRTVYRQNKQAKYANKDDFLKELERSGKTATELVVRGESRGFDEEFNRLLGDLASSATDIARGPVYANKSVTGEYEDEDLNEIIDQILNYEN